MYKTKENVWTSNYWKGINNKLIYKSALDTDDPTGICRFHGGDCMWKIDSGILTMSGEYPRLYLPNEWMNTEAIMYYMKTEEAGKDSDGLNFGFRSGVNGHRTTHTDNATTYYTRIRHDGFIDIVKEAVHNQSYQTLIKMPYFQGRLPINKWIGMKSIVMNLSPSQVHIMMYIDEGFGFIKILEYIDSNDVFDKAGMIFIRDGWTKSSMYRDISIREIVKTLH
jgi:hypothetical protein